MIKKYRLVNPRAGGMYQVQALRDFGDVVAGDIGGFVSGEHNLSHYDTCWIYDEAEVMDDARVVDSAKVMGKSNNKRQFHSRRLFFCYWYINNKRPFSYLWLLICKRCLCWRPLPYCRYYLKRPNVHSRGLW